MSSDDASEKKNSEDTAPSSSSSEKKRKVVTSPSSPSSRGDRNDEENGGSVEEAADDSNISSKKPRDMSKIVDYAKRRGLQAGDRLQVLWTVQNDEHESSPTVSSASRWWGATLEEWNGLVEEDMAIRVLDYDAFPPHFPERSRERVIFAEQADTLVTYPGLEPMQFRVEENEDDMDEVVLGGPEEVEQMLDAMLMRALQKNNQAWSKLTAAQQAIIADQIAQKKTKLLELIEQHHESKPVLSSTDVQRILAQTMEP